VVKTEYEAMPSSALARWQGKRAAELDGLEAVQQALRDAGRQRMSTTQQVNHAWAMLLSSHFQGFCRNLLDELNRWRNAIAHQDFDPAALGGRVRMDWGGVEAIFERGAAAGTRRKQDEIPPR